ncbi:hypothetical protein CRUP_014678 [Coryphaenoides rupestris]|nr:hypothetical protein CRUP_014678 [Coryphaenoides rupestris]
MGDSGASSSGTSSSSGLARMGDSRPLTVLALELVRERKSVQASRSSLLRDAGLPGHLDSPEGLSPPPSTATDCNAAFFLAARPRAVLWYLLLLSMETARRRGALPPLPPSGLIIHQELFPVPSFCTRMKRLCRDSVGSADMRPLSVLNQSSWNLRQSLPLFSIFHVCLESWQTGSRGGGGGGGASCPVALWIPDSRVLGIIPLLIEALTAAASANANTNTSSSSPPVYVMCDGDTCVPGHAGGAVRVPGPDRASRMLMPAVPWRVDARPACPPHAKDNWSGSTGRSLSLSLSLAGQWRLSVRGLIPARARSKTITPGHGAPLEHGGELYRYRIHDPNNDAVTRHTLLHAIPPPHAKDNWSGSTGRSLSLSLAGQWRLSVG